VVDPPGATVRYFEGESTEVELGLWDEFGPLLEQKGPNGVAIARQSIVRIRGVLPNAVPGTLVEVNDLIVPVIDGEFTIHELVRGPSQIEVRVMPPGLTVAQAVLDVVGPDRITADRVAPFIGSPLMAGVPFVPQCLGLFVDDFELPLGNDEVTMIVDGAELVVAAGETEGSDVYVARNVGEVVVRCVHDAIFGEAVFDVGPGFAVTSIARGLNDETELFVRAGEEVEVQCTGFDHDGVETQASLLMPSDVDPRGHLRATSWTSVVATRAGTYEVVCDGDSIERHAMDALTIHVTPDTARESTWVERALIPKEVAIGDVIPLDLAAWNVDAYMNVTQNPALFTLVEVLPDGTRIPVDEEFRPVLPPATPPEAWPGRPLIPTRPGDFELSSPGRPDFRAPIHVFPDIQETPICLFSGYYLDSVQPNELRIPGLGLDEVTVLRVLREAHSAPGVAELGRIAADATLGLTSYQVVQSEEDGSWVVRWRNVSSSSPGAPSQWERVTVHWRDQRDSSAAAVSRHTSCWVMHRFGPMESRGSTRLIARPTQDIDWFFASPNTSRMSHTSIINSAFANGSETAALFLQSFMGSTTRGIDFHEARAATWQHETTCGVVSVRGSTALPHDNACVIPIDEVPGGERHWVPQEALIVHPQAIPQSEEDALEYANHAASLNVDMPHIRGCSDENPPLQTITVNFAQIERAFNGVGPNGGGRVVERRFRAYNVNFGVFLSSEGGIDTVYADFPGLYDGHFQQACVETTPRLRTYRVGLDNITIERARYPREASAHFATMRIDTDAFREELNACVAPQVQAILRHQLRTMRDESLASISHITPSPGFDAVGEAYGMRTVEGIVYAPTDAQVHEIAQLNVRERILFQDPLQEITRPTEREHGYFASHGTVRRELERELGSGLRIAPVRSGHVAVPDLITGAGDGAFLPPDLDGGERPPGEPSSGAPYSAAIAFEFDVFNTALAAYMLGGGTVLEQTTGEVLNGGRFADHRLLPDHLTVEITATGTPTIEALADSTTRGGEALIVATWPNIVVRLGDTESVVNVAFNVQRVMRLRVEVGHLERLHVAAEALDTHPLNIVTMSSTNPAQEHALFDRLGLPGGFFPSEAGGSELRSPFLLEAMEERLVYLLEQMATDALVLARFPEWRAPFTVATADQPEGTPFGWIRSSEDEQQDLSIREGQLVLTGMFTRLGIRCNTDADCACTPRPNRPECLSADMICGGQNFCTEPE